MIFYDFHLNSFTQVKMFSIENENFRKVKEDARKKTAVLSDSNIFGKWKKLPSILLFQNT